MLPKIKAPLALAAALSLGLTLACSQQAAQPASKQAQNTSNDTGDDDSGGGNGGNNSNGSNNGSTGGKAGSGDFNGWCQAAGQTEVAQQALGQYFAKLCNNGKATSLFTTTLVNLAYSGSGSPQIKYLEPIKSDGNNTTTAYFGIGIKLPISIQQHFDQIGPKAGDKEQQQKLTEAQGAQQQSLDITPRQSQDKFWTRGWEVHSVATQQQSIVTLTIDNVVDSDQYELKKGSLYLYTSVTDQSHPTQTIKDYSLLTAGVQVNGTGYLITIAHLAADNHGLSGIAEDKIKTTAVSVIKAMYNISVPGGSISGSGTSGGATGGTDNGGGGG